MLVVGIILTVSVLVLAIAILSHADADERSQIGSGIVMTLILMGGILLIVGSIEEIKVIEHKASEYTVKAKTVTTLIDDKVVSSDTIYVFTPKLNK
jgi:hypothetical protein